MKNKKLFAMLTLICFMFTLMPVAAFADTQPTVEAIEPTYDWYTDATGSVYYIDSVGDLAGLAKLTQGAVNEAGTNAATNFAGETVKLTADITFEDDQYWYYNDGAGKVYDYRIYTFAGILDGDDHTIKGLRFYSNVYDKTIELGLIHTVTADGSVKNLKINTARADFTNYVVYDRRNSFGAIAYAMNGKADKCDVTGVVVNVEAKAKVPADGGDAYGYTSNAGAMFGTIFGSTAAVTNSDAYDVKIILTGVDNGQYVGGFAGLINGGASVSNCSIEKVTFDCTNKLKGFGGFVGRTDAATLTDCTATDVTFDIDNYGYYTGGFVGWAKNGSAYTRCNVNSCYLTCGSSGGYLGGFVALTENEVEFDDCHVIDLNIDAKCDSSNDRTFGGFISRQSGTASIENCSVSGTISVSGTGQNALVGGFVGYSNGNKLEVNNCSADTVITATATAGGFVGQINKEATLTGCKVNSGSVTSSNGAAGGLIGYINDGADVTFGEDCIPAGTVKGPITNEVANAPKENYTYDASTGITSTSYLCHGTVGGKEIGYTSIQAAVDAGANTVTLLQNVKEDFVVEKEETTDFVLNLNDNTLEGTVKIHHKIHSVAFNYTGESNGSKILLTDPEGAHSVFEGWCSGSNDKYELAAKNDDGYWVVEPGTTYHTHYVTSGLTEIPEDERHLTIPKVAYGYVVGNALAKTFTFEVDDEAPANFSAKIVAFEESKYFDVIGDGLTVTIKPKAGLNAGKYSEKIYVFVEENVATHEGANHTSSHELFVDFEVFKVDSTVTPSNSNRYVYAVGDPITITAEVAMAKSRAGLNEVVFLCDGAPLGEAVTVDEGMAILVLEQGFDTAGTYKITAEYGGSVNLNGSNMAEITIEVKEVQTSTDGSFSQGGVTATPSEDGTGKVEYNNGNVVIGGGASLNDGSETAQIPSDVIVAVPAGKLDEVEVTENGDIILPEGSEVEIGTGSNTTTIIVPEDASADNNIIVKADGTVVVPEDTTVTVNDTTVTGPAEVGTDENGNTEVTVGAGGSITNGNGTVIVPSGVAVTVPADKLDEVTENNGEITLPEGSKVEIGTGSSKIEIEATTGSVTVDQNGTVIVDKDEAITVGSTVVNGPVTVDKNGTVTANGQEIIITANGTTIKLPAGSEAEIAANGSVTVSAGTTVIADGKEYIVENGTVTVNPNGTVNIPAGTVLKNADGTTQEFPYGGSIAADGTVTVNPKPSTGGGFSGSYNYPVNAGDVEGAKVTFSDNNAVAGEKVTITVTPDSGKQVDEVIVTDADGDVITVTKVGDNQYSFTMPAGKVNVAVTTKAISYDNKIVLQIGNQNVVVDGKATRNDVAPVIQGDRTLVPIRVIVEALGGDVDWDAATRTVTLTIDGKVLTLVIDEMIPGFGQGATIMDSRTYVPIRYVAEYIGANVEWIAETQQIVILK